MSTCIHERVVIQLESQEHPESHMAECFSRNIDTKRCLAGALWALLTSQKYAGMRCFAGAQSARIVSCSAPHSPHTPHAQLKERQSSMYFPLALSSHAVPGDLAVLSGGCAHRWDRLPREHVALCVQQLHPHSKFGHKDAIHSCLPFRPNKLVKIKSTKSRKFD